VEDHCDHGNKRGKDRLFRDEPRDARGPGGVDTNIDTTTGYSPFHAANRTERVYHFASVNLRLEGPSRFGPATVSRHPVSMAYVSGRIGRGQRGLGRSNVLLTSSAREYMF
jgi:hypothetical protein